MDSNTNNHDPNEIDDELKIGDSVINFLYPAFRDETLKRLEMRQQFIAMNLTIVGLLLGFGVTTQSVAFLHPPLAVVLAAGWIHNELRLRQVSCYIRDILEPSLHGLGWEKYRISTDHEIERGDWPLELVSAGGVFLATQLISVSIGVFNFQNTRMEWFLVAIDVLCVIGLIVLLWDYKRRGQLYTTPSKASNN